MRKESTRSPSESRAHWEDLEEWVRGQIQGLIQELLEEEITELLGRAKSARRSTLDVLDKLPKREHAQAKLLLCRIPYSQSRKEAERLRSIFSTWCHERAHQAASEALERDWERMVTFYHFPREHWQHLRTTNPVQSPFAALRLRTDAAKRYKRVDRATAVIWKMLTIAEKRFRRLKAPGLMRNVYLGTLYMDGMAIEATVEEVAA